MRFSLGLAVAALLAISLVMPAGAAASTEFGDTCAADTGAPVPYTLTTLSAPPGALPLTAPSSGVITKVKINLAAAIPFTIPMSVKVLRSVGGNTFSVINQTDVDMGGNLTVADARLPVQSGDRLGMFGRPFSIEGEPVPGFIFYCKGVEGMLGAVPADVPPGSSAEFVEAATGRIPVAAVLEADADGDGFGDETQDKCPQAASTQVECPVIVLDSFPLAKKSSIVVLVAASESGSVTVSGTAKLPKAKKAGASAQAKLKKVKKNVTAGKIARFTLKLPGNLRAALKSLPRGKKITVKLQATATNVAGQVSKDKAKLKLK
jgi:hypothetical protein